MITSPDRPCHEPSHVGKPCNAAQCSPVKAGWTRFYRARDCDMACGEFGPGRMADVPDLVKAVTNHLNPSCPLGGKHALITSGPTQEALDPCAIFPIIPVASRGLALAAQLARQAHKSPLSLARQVCPRRRAWRRWMCTLPSTCWRRVKPPFRPYPHLCCGGGRLSRG